MISDTHLFEQLPHVLAETNYDFLGVKYAGKVRDNYSVGDKRYLITTDRLSCFDVVVTTIPFKGQALNQIAAFWFERTADIVQNHVIDIPDPNVMVVRRCEVLPVEVIVRSYLAGSAWRDYQAGRTISGVRLPAGLSMSQKLPHKLITPSTKAEKGAHDTPVSEEEILSAGLVDRKVWQEIREASLALFEYGEKEAAKHGLLLVDTKYEFGMAQGKLYLVDEIHTMDSSRYWVANTYQARYQSGEPPEMLDKEPTRQWLLSKGYQGEGAIPQFTDEHRVKIARHYCDSFEKITGNSFQGGIGNVRSRIEKRLRTLMQ